MSGAHKAIVVGSFNAAKAAEIIHLLGNAGAPTRTLSEFPGVSPVPEDGTTFAENARAKALGLARRIPPDALLAVLAEDSGLEVDALDGRPGVYSARYVSETATDPQRVQHLLEELGNLPVESRTARFRCCVALADASAVLLETEGTVEGRIAFAPAGDFGFGYDPVFVPRGHEKTFAELGPDVKHSMSHRAVALRAFRERLAEFLRGLSGKEGKA